MPNAKYTIVQIVMYDTKTGDINVDGVQSITQKMLDEMVLTAGTSVMAYAGKVHPDTHKVDTTQTPHLVVSYIKPVDMEAARRDAKWHIDWKAAKQRSLTVSHGYGQEMVYMAKEIEARAMLKDASPKVTQYRLLAAEVGITAPTLRAVGSLIRGKADQQKSLYAGIETERLRTKQAIDQASNALDVDKALKAGVAALNAQYHTKAPTP